MQARRDVLRSVGKQDSTHAGLWLDKFLVAQTVAREDEPSADSALRAGEGKKAELIRDVSTLKCPDGYWNAIQRRCELFRSLAESGQAKYCTATAQGRLIIGLGQKGPIEAGLALEHTWGVPILPGSALKGIMVSAAHQLLADPSWHKKADGTTQPGKDAGGSTARGSSLAELAGTIEHTGKVVFHDAWWLPSAPDSMLPIHLDVMTVHHQDYYSTKGGAAPTDMDNPNPVAFASVTGKFFIAVEKNHPEADASYLDAALHILGLGLAELGIGAKTNAGYGRMQLDYRNDVEKQREAAQKQQQQRAAALADAQAMLRGLNDGNAAQQVPRILGLLASHPDAAAVARHAVEKLTAKKVKAKANEGKQWAMDLLQAAAPPNSGA